MFNPELARAIESDRRREIEAHLDHRRAIREQSDASRLASHQQAARQPAGRPGTAVKVTR